jgi:hypothetical protein
LSRPFYFESQEPPEADVFLYEQVMNLRAEYSIPYEEARQKAVEMLEYLNRYSATMLKVKPRARRTKRGNTSSDDAAYVLLQQAGADIAQSTHEVIDDAIDLDIEPPWRAEADTDREVGGKDLSDDATETILGKGMLDGWNDITFEDEENG